MGDEVAPSVDPAAVPLSNDDPSVKECPECSSGAGARHLEIIGQAAGTRGYALEVPPVARS